MRFIRFAAIIAAIPFSLVAAEHLTSVGTATMQASGTIVMQLVSLPPGPIAHATMTVKPSDQNYKEIFDHVGGMKPSETKSVPA
jgi:hypothetical protein